MSDFNYRGKLPFRIVSSSVNTGYNAELTTSVGRNIEVVNQHSDEYSELQDSPMQGPFTQQWVGGNQHRHIDLNNGSDDPTNRPEAFLISGSANKIRVYGPAHFDETAPKAVLTREEVAKRPLNIKNILTKDGKLGNFSHNYEVVQTSGRDINQSLIVNNLTASGVLTTKFINFTSPAVATIPAIATNGDFQFQAIPIGLDSGNSLRVELLFGQPTAQITEVGFDVTVSLTSSGWTNWDVGDFIAITSNWVSGIPKFYDTYFYDETATSAFSFIDFGSGLDGIAAITVGEYTLPDLANDRNKSVFVERFSAPGDKKESSRGVLDRESEQYSPNNSLITRNIGVRQPYYNRLTKHNSKFYTDDNIQLIPVATNLESKTFSGSLSVSAQDTSPRGFYFKQDGTEFFIVGQTNNRVHRYSLSTEFEIATATHISNFSISVQTTTSSGISFSTDGAKMFIVGGTSVYLYNLSSAWDITTAIFSSTFNFGVSPTGVVFDSSGTRLFISTTAGGSSIREYTLSSAWNITTPVLKETFNVSDKQSLITGIFFDDLGLELIICGEVQDRLVKYSLTKDRELTSATYEYLLPITEDQLMHDVYVTPQKDKLFIIGTTNDKVYQYKLDNTIFGEHSVNKNSIQKIEEYDSNYVTSSVNDNFWVQHAIPRTDLRYKWIADSYLTSSTTAFFGYQRLGIDSEEILFNSSSFAVSGTNKSFAIDNIGINSLVKDKKSIDIIENIFTITNPSLSASYSEIANTPYGFSTWKQLRTGEHPIARKLRENNVVSIEDSKSKVINGTQQESRYSDNVRQYTEPPVTSKFKPLQQTLELKANNENYVFTYTHGNNLSSFVNTEIVDRLGINENSQQMHDLLRKYYIAQNRKEDPKNPFNQLVNYKYSETLYPREVNAYMAETRGRTQYILDQAGTGSRDGFDIQLGTQRAFWRDRLQDRTRSSFVSLNSLNYNNDLSLEEQILYKSSSIELPGYGTYTGREWLNITNSLYPHSFGPNNSIHCFDNSLQTQILYGFNDLKLDGLFIFNGFGNLDTGSLQITNTIVTNLGTGELNREIFLDYFASCSVDYVSSDENNYPTFLEGTKKQLTRVTPHSVLLQHIPDLEQFHIFDPKYIFPDYYPSYASMSQSLPQPRPNYVAFIGGFESGSRSYGISDPQTIEEYEVYNTQPTGPILSTLDSGLRYSTESFGDKKPWFDTYEDYIDDIRPLAKDHSIIPEFRISSNMPYYVIGAAGNFRSPNKAFLEIDGVGQNYRSAAIPQILAYNQNFINSYVTTDVADYTTKLERENRPVSKPESIKFTISGIKKLLPYNGFYPQERTIQLANLFNDFLDQNIAGGYFSLFKTIQSSSAGAGDAANALIYNSDNSGGYWSKNTIMPYFFSPGILFNTIKSGISVDFPAMTASIADLQESTNNPPLGVDQLTVTEINLFDKCSMLSLQYDLFDLSAPKNSPSNRIDPYEFEASYLPKNKINSRVPFESIIFPQSFITKPSYVTSSFAYASRHDITVTASKDLELEGIYSKYISNSVLNIKFDCNHQPDRYHQPLYSFGVAPSMQPDFINLGYYQKNSVPFCYLRDDTIIDPSYSMAMSNFLAEIPTFFLKQQSADRDQHLNVFRSSELKNWKPFQIGKKYYLDIKMKKSSDLVMMEAYRSEYHVTGNNAIEKTFNGRYFGWPVDKVSGSRTVQDNYVVHNDPAYAPFTPPYFEGEAILRFELSAASASYNTVGELFKDLRLTDIFNELGQSAHTASEAYLNKMSIQDCMEVFGIGANPVSTFEANGTARSQDATPNTQTQYWAISPKLETPVLDFSDQEFVAHTGSYWVSSGYGRGMWSGYGKIPTGSKGITIEIAESFPLQNSGRFNNFTNPANLKLTGSLLDQVGFTAQSSKIGQLADTKDISEAIVAIPYVDKPITGVTTFIDGHHFIAINRNIYAELKSAIEIGTTLSIPGQPAGYESSITKMIKSMNNYVIPPNFNFSKYGNIDPFVMYLFEFKHTLDQQDLADIWQGVMPKIAYKAEEDQVVIDHKFGPYELFGGNYSTPENLRWMIFKVKKKAEWNYFAITENIGDDNRFKFNFANSQVAQTPDYSYNWPYDYFSLVELAKVDITMEYSGSQTIPLQTAVIINNGNTTPLQTAVTIVDSNTTPLQTAVTIVDSNTTTTNTNPMTRRRASTGLSLDTAQKTAGKFK